MNPTGLLMGLCAASVLAGCAAPPAPVSVLECKSPTSTAPKTGPALVGQSYGMQLTPIPLDALQFTDVNTSKQLAVQHLSAERTPTETVRVNARLVNCTDRAVSVYVRTSFMDGRQAPTEAPSGWQIVNMQPRSFGVYSESSTTTSVANYLIEVRPSN